MQALSFPKQLDAAQLLLFLQLRGGQEFQAVLLRRTGKGQQAVWQPGETYLFTVRGHDIEATGPSGQTRQLSPERFLEVFGSSVLGPPRATGRLTDLGPLFGPEPENRDSLE